MSNSLRPHGVVACQAPLSIGFSRQEYWSGLPFSPPGDFPNPGIKPRPLMSPALAGRFFTVAPPGRFFLLLLLDMIFSGAIFCSLKTRLSQGWDETRWDHKLRQWSHRWSRGKTFVILQEIKSIRLNEGDKEDWEMYMILAQQVNTRMVIYY